MPTRTICCKMVLSPEIEKDLEKTSVHFAKGCNHILQYAVKGNTSNAITLHKLCYAEVRAQCQLPANLTVRALRRVAGSMQRLGGKRRAPKSFEPKSIDYDARLFYYIEQGEEVSLRTLNKRWKIPLQLGRYQREALAGQKPTAATVIRKKSGWYIHIVVERASSCCKENKSIGIDLGIRNIASLSTGLQVQGTARQAFKKERAKIRASLQSKGTGGAKKRLKQLSGKERRRIKHDNHVLSKQLVEEAKRHGCGIIRMEQLKSMRDRTKTWNKHLNRAIAGWSFYQLQQFVKYKAEVVGISVELIDPHYSSQTCHCCLRRGSREGERFFCITCGEHDADLNAAHVISLGGVACKPARISNAS